MTAPSAAVPSGTRWDMFYVEGMLSIEYQARMRAQDITIAAAVALAAGKPTLRERAAQLGLVSLVER